MNDLHSPTALADAPEPIDVLLSNFYRSETPSPWPVMRAPETMPRPLPPRTRKRWFQIGVRMALAASIGFVLVAYLALARNFPSVDVSPRLQRGADDIGLKLSPKRVKTPKGGEALMWENRPGDRIILDLQMIKGPASGRPDR